MGITCFSTTNMLTDKPQMGYEPLIFDKACAKFAYSGILSVVALAKNQELL